MQKNETLRISRMTVQDLHRLHELQPELWGDILPGNRFYLQANHYTVKAELDNQIAGIGTAILHANAAWIANIITHPGFRGKGVGTSVTEHVVNYAREQVNSVLLIATPLGQPIYARMGFVASGAYLIFNEGRLTQEIPTQVEPFHEEYREDIYSLDYQTTGEDRKKLLAPYLHQSWVYRDSKHVLGFFIPLLGEGLTVAATPEAGITLLKLHLLEKKRISVPEANTTAVDFLKANGFTVDEERKLTYMYLGEPVAWNPAYLYGRIGGNLG